MKIGEQTGSLKGKMLFSMRGRSCTSGCGEYLIELSEVKMLRNECSRVINIWSKGNGFDCVQSAADVWNKQH